MDIAASQIRRYVCLDTYMIPEDPGGGASTPRRPGVMACRVRRDSVRELGLPLMEREEFTMKRAIAAVLLGVVLFVPAPAGAPGVSVGLKGGAVFASIPQITKDFDGTGIDVGQRLGFIGGGFLTLSVL